MTTREGIVEVRPLEPPSLAIEKADDVAIIRLSGEHGAETASEITTAIHRVALASRGVVLSLADVTFMDSSVIRALVVGDEELLQSGRRLVLYVDTGSVAGRVLELCRRNEMLCFAETLPQAILVAKQAPDVIPAA